MQIGEQRVGAQRLILSSAAKDIARRVLGDGLEKKGSGRGVPKPYLGVVLGTGMGGLVDRLEEKQSVDFSELGWLPSVTAIGHAGRLVGVPLRIVPSSCCRDEFMRMRDSRLRCCFEA